MTTKATQEQLEAFAHDLLALLRKHGVSMDARPDHDAAIITATFPGGADFKITADPEDVYVHDDGQHPHVLARARHTTLHEVPRTEDH